MAYIEKQSFTNRNFFFAILMVLAMVQVGHTQKEPQYTQYMYNIGSFNPAYVNSTETAEIAGLYRAQWIDIPGAPRTIRFGTNFPLSNETMGLGFNVISDQLGPSTQTYIDLAYAYQFNVSSSAKLSFGMDVGGSFLNVDFSKGRFRNPGEPILNSEIISKFYPTIGAGLFLYEDETWYLGLSIPNFLTDGIYDDDVATIIEDKIQFNFIGGYVFDFSESLKFKPAVMMNMISGAPINFNISGNFLIKDRFTLGTSYRLDNAVSGLAGFQISNTLFLGYSYDYNTNTLGDFNSGSHEVILKFYLGKGKGEGESGGSKDPKLKGKPKQIDSPRFF